MSLEADLLAWLPAQASIAALVGTRVYDFPAPEGVARPFIAMERGASVDEFVLAGTPIGLPTAQVQIDCWGDTRVDARALADAVRIALNGYRGLIGTTRVQAARSEGDTPSYDDQVRQFAVRLDFAITFEE